MKMLLSIFILFLSLFLISCSEEVICPEPQQCPQLDEKTEEGIAIFVGQELFDSLLENKKQAFLSCWEDECRTRLTMAKKSKIYDDYRKCSLECLEKPTEIVNDGITDISDFPSMFVEGEFFEGLIIAGQNAAPPDVLPAIILVSSLEEYFPKLPLLDVHVDNPFLQNTIIVGGPCINSVAADFFGNPQECNKVSSINNGNSFIPNTGNIKLIKHDNGNYGLLVGGYAGPDSQLAANILIHRTSELKGMEFTVTSQDGTWQNAVINKIS
jgi:hypothetical protein